MKREDKDDIGGQPPGADPMLEFRARFAEIRDLMERQITPEDRAQLSVRPESFDRVRDMVRGQIMLFHAERALDEEFKRMRGDDDDASDKSILRDQISSKLDRIRASLAAEPLSEQPDDT